MKLFIWKPISTVHSYFKIAAQRSSCLNVGFCHFCSSLRATTTWWSTTTRKPSLCLATRRSPSLKKVFSSSFFSFLSYITCDLFFFLFFSQWSLSLCSSCSVRWGGDQDRSPEKSSVGQTAADSVNAARSEEIHQVWIQQTIMHSRLDCQSHWRKQLQFGLSDTIWHAEINSL